MREGAEIAQVNRGEEINKWGDSLRKTDTGSSEQRRQQSGGVEGDRRERNFSSRTPSVQCAAATGLESKAM